jgi:hypothetical protein
MNQDESRWIKMNQDESRWIKMKAKDHSREEFKNCFRIMRENSLMKANLEKFSNIKDLRVQARSIFCSDLRRQRRQSIKLKSSERQCSLVKMNWGITLLFSQLIGRLVCLRNAEVFQEIQQEKSDVKSFNQKFT